MDLPPYVVDLQKDESGIWACSLFDGEKHLFLTLDSLDEMRAVSVPHDRELLSFDCRPLLDIGWTHRVTDVQLLHGFPSVSRLAVHLGRNDVAEVEQQVRANRKAAHTACVDLGQCSLFEMVPRSLLVRAFRLRGEAIMHAWTSASDDERDLVRRRMRVMPVLRSIERAGVHFDRDYVAYELEDGTLEAHEGRFYRNLLLRAAEGDIVRTKYTPGGTKTGRIGYVRGLNTLSIPKGRCRRALTSRFEGGQVVSFDFNAIDFRCIVASIPELEPVYSGHDDFHLRTREFCGLGWLTRDQVKSATHTYNYGGSVETIAKQTGLRYDEADRAYELLGDKLGAVAEFRKRLHAEATGQGFVDSPGGLRVPVEPGDHPGKVLGLYAQSYASEVFERALEKVHDFILLNGLRSAIVFPVHDEMVLDVPAAELDRVETIRGMVEDTVGGSFRVRVKRGDSYDL